MVGQPLRFGLGFMLAPSFPPGGPTVVRALRAQVARWRVADPERGLAFAYVMNQMRLSVTEPDPRAMGLVKAIYESLDA